MPHLISESGRASRRTTRCCWSTSSTSRRQVEPVPPRLGDDPHPLLRRHEGEPRRAHPRAARRGVPRRHLRQGADQRVLRERRLHAARQGRRGAALPLHADAPCSSCSATTGPRTRKSPPTSTPRWWTATSRNFSVFQSLPDNWAIDQLFPIMPIHRLGERPTRRGTIQDITCDSDGVIDRFAGGRKGKPSLELHACADGDAYILGIFLTGRLPGDPGRPPQPLRRHQRGARAPVEGRRLPGDRPGARRHRHRGAQLRAVPRLRPAGHLAAQSDRGQGSLPGRGQLASLRTTSRGSRATPTSRARPGPTSGYFRCSIGTKLRVSGPV